MNLHVSSPRKWMWSAALAVLAACNAPQGHNTDVLEPPHGKDIAGNFDPSAARVTLSPDTAINPVRSQHVLVATVTTEDGHPLGGRRVEWMIPEGSLGAIVGIDEHGVYTDNGSKDVSSLQRAQIGDKHTPNFAVTHTTNVPERLTFGTKDTSDDLIIEPGQTWIAITSAVEGTTDVIAYAPGIRNWANHKAFATKHWMDVAWVLPGDAANRVGTDHGLSTQVMKHSDKSPLAGYLVTYKLVSGPKATFEPGGKDWVTVTTDAKGLANATLKQAAPAEGDNVVAISIVRPGNKDCCEPEKLIATGEMTKTWMAPTIGITKSAPAQVNVGDDFKYAIVVGNDSHVATRETVLTDVLPEGIAYVASSPAAKVEGSKLSWNLGTIEPGAKSEVSITVKATKTGKFTNCADVAAEAGLKGRACADTVAVAPELQLTKTAPAEVLLCDGITYTYVVKNNGTGPATGVKIADTLPAGLSVGAGGTNVSFDVGTLKAGESKTFTAKAAASKTGEYVNKATASGNGGLKAEASAKTIVRQPVLNIAKVAPERVFIGRPVNYDITVKNTGDAASADTVVVDTLPAGVTFVSASEGGTMAAGKVTWNLGSLAANASRTLRVTVTAAAAGNLVNAVTAKGTCADPVSAQATTRVEGIPALLLEVIDTDDPIEVGGNETYVIVVTNQGSAPDTQIVIKATLPAEMTFVSASGPSAHTAAGQVITFAAVPSLAPKAQLTYRVIAKGNAAGDVRFAVAMNSAELTTPVDETEATRIY